MRFFVALTLPLLIAGCGSFGGGGGGAPANDRDLEAICGDVAASRLGVGRHNVLVLPAPDSGAIPGQAVLPDGTVVTFACDLDRAGNLTGFSRTS
jgi:hypothetical protein